MTPAAKRSRLPAKIASIPTLRPDASVRHISLQGMMGSIIASGMMGQFTVA
ncbi:MULTISPECIES: hypothetical protein [Thiomonas]|uniref:hypothetical protein n=1 Tax=Thiomonas TaxID=32012 RepID=UPI0007C33721|nr:MULTISPECIES: hypothetical protein [Thiomonas]CQR36011.1 hypothetical protein THICB6_240038 [Thiomonas arsenitoxydans]